MYIFVGLLTCKKFFLQYSYFKYCNYIKYFLISKLSLVSCTIFSQCLLHCVYARNHAIDHKGWPTLDGLVHFYSEGVDEHGFFMATLRAVNLCLRTMTVRYRVNRKELPQRGESCDLAFDVFDCISDQITGYCLDQYSRY